jgi:hypothetical protein
MYILIFVCKCLSGDEGAGSSCSETSLVGYHSARIISSEQTVASAFDDDVGKNFVCTRLHSITYDVIMILHKPMNMILAQLGTILPAFYATQNFVLSQMDTIHTLRSRFNIIVPPTPRHISSQSQQKLATLSSPSCLFTLTFIVVLLSFSLIISYLPFFPFSVYFSSFFSFVFPNSLPWLIYLSFFLYVFHYLSTYFFYNLCIYHPFPLFFRLYYFLIFVSASLRFPVSRSLFFVVLLFRYIFGLFLVFGFCLFTSSSFIPSFLPHLSFVFDLFRFSW